MYEPTTPWCAKNDSNMLPLSLFSFLKIKHHNIYKCTRSSNPSTTNKYPNVQTYSTHSLPYLSGTLWFRSLICFHSDGLCVNQTDQAALSIGRSTCTSLHRWLRMSYDSLSDVHHFHILSHLAVTSACFYSFSPFGHLQFLSHDELYYRAHCKSGMAHAVNLCRGGLNWTKWVFFGVFFHKLVQAGAMWCIIKKGALHHCGDKHGGPVVPPIKTALGIPFLCCAQVTLR